MICLPRVSPDGSTVLQVSCRLGKADVFIQVLDFLISICCSPVLFCSWMFGKSRMSGGFYQNVNNQILTVGIVWLFLRAPLFHPAHNVTNATNITMLWWHYATWIHDILVKDTLVMDIDHNHCSEPMKLEIIFYKEICLYRIFIGFTKMPCYQNVGYQDVLLPKCLLPKCPVTEMFCYRNVLWPKYPVTEMSCYRNVSYQNIHYQSVLYRNVWIPCYIGSTYFCFWIFQTVCLVRHSREDW